MPRTRRTAALAVVPLIGLGLTGLAVAPAQAAIDSYTVTTLDGAVATSGSLPWAIAQAEGDPDHTTIDFDLPGTGPWTITLANSFVDINEPLDIVGPGSELLTVDAGDTYFTFRVIDNTGEVSISGLTVQSSVGHGIESENSDLVLDDVRSLTHDGDGLQVEGGSVEVSDSVFSGNEGDGVDIDGIDGDSRLTGVTADENEESGFDLYLEGVELIVSGITATDNGEEGVYAYVESGGYLEITDSLVEDNGFDSSYDGFSLDGWDAEILLSGVTSRGHGDDGIEVNADGSDLVVTVEDSTSDGNDYGLYVPNGYPGFELTVTGSTFSNSETCGILAGTSGGAIIRVVNSTVSGTGDPVTGTAGCSAIDLWGDEGETSGIFELLHSTVTDNTGFAGLFAYDGAEVLVSHSIVAGNEVAEDSGDIAVTLDSELSIEHSLAGSVAEGSISSVSGTGHLYAASGELDAVTVIEGPGNIITEDPGLEPLADNGGPTLTHTLLSTSPALDGGDPGITGAPETDQRGEARISGSAIDIGAVEIEQALPATGAESGAGLAAALALLLGGLGLLGYRTLRRRTA